MPKKKFGPIAYRLFREPEIKELEKFLLDKEDLKEQFPDYEKWIKKVIPQIIGSVKDDSKESKTGRLAFGLFEGAPTEDDEISKKMIGTSLLNLSTSKTVELKSFYIDSQEKEVVDELSRKLLHILEDHCLRHGIKKIETSILSTDIHMLKIFLKRGYKLLNEEDIYQNKKLRVRLKKELVPFYDGDPFDWNQISRWFLEYFINAYEINGKKKEVDFKVDVSNIKFPRILPKKENLRLEFDEFKFTLDGKGHIEDKIDKFQVKNKFKKSLKERKHITLFMLKEANEKVKSEILKNNGILLDHDTIIKESKKLILPSFPKTKIGGMIVEVRPNYFENIGGKKNFVYFKGAKIGRQLSKGHIIFIFVLPSGKEIKGQICGYGYLKKKPTVGEPEKEWKRYSRNSTLIPKSEFNQFIEDKDEIMSLHIERFEFITGIGLEKIKKILDSKLEPEDVGHQYISKKMKDELLEYPKGVKLTRNLEGHNRIISELRSFAKHCEATCQNSFWTKKGDKKPEPESNATSLLQMDLRRDYYHYDNVKVGDGYVDILLRPKGKEKHYVMELKINYGPLYIKEGLNRLEKYIVNAQKKYDTEKDAYYIIFDLTVDGRAKKKYDGKEKKFKYGTIHYVGICLPPRNRVKKKNVPNKKLSKKRL